MDKVLPNETLSHILGYLKTDQNTLFQLGQTCKKFCDLTSPLLYRAPKFDTLDQFEKFTNALTDMNSSYVRHIDLHMVPHRWNSSLINPLLYSMALKTTELESLNLDLCSQLTNKALARITERLHDLRLLSLDQCELIGDEAVCALAANCPYIQDLYLGSTQITDNALYLLSAQFILLTHLHVPYCERITEAGVNKLISECKTLKYLNIRDCYNVVGVDMLPQSTDRRTSMLAAGTLNDEEDDDEWTDLDDEEEM
ncbi:hypothetical protein BDF20DRAFT_885502 [Mycotypha africana]|uniref:uncharacterized protein n=1 Tax=Mycotypha africana TaxID=64632 RepID=UPI0023014277|nr:uncharacterized protein BDF20DRAFT_885502 [Mycotypha africana]KAI8971637.1 hypothetical protein BDF20DRAFT_885502 [Mycotypha africana]